MDMFGVKKLNGPDNGDYCTWALGSKSNGCQNCCQNLNFITSNFELNYFSSINFNMVSMIHGQKTKSTDLRIYNGQTPGKRMATVSRTV